MASLYRVAAACGLAAVGLALGQVVIEITGVGVAGIPVPGSAEGWFDLLQRNRLLGFTELTGLQIPMFALLVPLFLALYVALRGLHPTVALLGTAFALLGIGVYLASNTALSMLSLSDQWAAAATDAERAMVIAAGTAMLAIYDGSGLDVGVPFVMVATLALAWAMLDGPNFGRFTAGAAIVAGLIGLAYYGAVMAPSVRIFLLEAAGLFFLVWIALAARGLYRTAQTMDRDNAR